MAKASLFVKMARVVLLMAEKLLPRRMGAFMMHHMLKWARAASRLPAGNVELTGANTPFPTSNMSKSFHLKADRKMETTGGIEAWW